MADISYWRKHYFRLLERLSGRTDIKHWEADLLAEFEKRAFPDIDEQKAA